MGTRKYKDLTVMVKDMTARQLAAVDRAYKRALNEGRAELRKVVADWEADVDFAVLPTKGATKYVYQIKAIGPGTDIFHYVDKGTRPHVIRPKKPGGVLAFQGAYSAKTAPVAKFNVGTGKKSGATIFRVEVNHPGNAARQFTKTILGLIVGKLPQYVREEFARL